MTILRHENSCVKACYACLLNYYNQRDHARIDKSVVVDFLEALSREQAAQGQMILAGPGVGAAPSAQTDWEYTLLRELEGRGLRGAVPEFKIVEPGNGKLVTVPDIAYPSERIAIYVDGDAHHTSREDREHDDRVRNRARELGGVLSRFPTLALHAISTLAWPKSSR